jgi:hypothetical protein
MFFHDRINQTRRRKSHYEAENINSQMQPLTVAGHFFVNSISIKNAIH